MVKSNAFLGSNATLLMKNNLKFCLNSEFVNFLISSNFNPQKARFGNVWSVDKSNLNSYKIRKTVQKYFYHLNNIPFENGSLEPFSFLTVADTLELQLLLEVRMCNKNKPITIVLVLAKVLLGERH